LCSGMQRQIFFLPFVAGRMRMHTLIFSSLMMRLLNARQTTPSDQKKLQPHLTSSTSNCDSKLPVQPQGAPGRGARHPKRARGLRGWATHKRVQPT
jgi:hypothetical protein